MNIGELVLAVLSSIIIGMLWYSPILFGNMWMQITGIRSDQIDKEKMNVYYVISSVASFISAVVLVYLQIEFDVQSLQQALVLGFTVWIGFTFTSTLVNNMYQGKPKTLTVIDAGYHLVTIQVMSVILYFL